MMSEQRKWGVHDCPNGFYYLADSIDGLYIGTGGHILDDDKDGILVICELLNEKESIISALKEENEQLRHEIEIEKKWQLAQDRYYVKIKEENEQLQKELDNFKPIMFKNMQKGTIILYSKGGIDE